MFNKTDKKMGHGLNREEADELAESFRRSDFCNRVASLPGKIFNFIWDCIMYGPGKGSVSTKKLVKTPVCIVETSIGSVNIPIMKIPCFELTFGFFLENKNYQEGIQDLDKFHESFPKNKVMFLKNVETYWLINYRRPSDINGSKKIYCYVSNDFENLIYITKIENNDIIDYEKIVDEYETELRNLEFIEKEMEEIDTNGGIRKKEL
jgi:hypothetical protein